MLDLTCNQPKRVGASDFVPRSYDREAGDIHHSRPSRARRTISKIQQKIQTQKKSKQTIKIFNLRLALFLPWFFFAAFFMSGRPPRMVPKCRYRPRQQKSQMLLRTAVEAQTIVFLARLCGVRHGGPERLFPAAEAATK